MEEQGKRKRGFTAVIPAAGKGTRFLPVTRVIPKEMLPVGAKPAIHVIAEEAIAAGAEKIVIVISQEKEIIRRYFEGDSGLREKTVFAYQHEQRGLGHAVLQAAEYVSGGDVLVLLGDALVSGPNASLGLVEASEANGGACAIGLEKIPRELSGRYGIADLGGFELVPGKPVRILDLVEKPEPEKAPGNFAIAGRYLLDRVIFDFLAKQTPGYGGELQLTDAIRALLREKPAFGCAYRGKRQDIGNPAGYLAALEAFNGNDKN